METPVFITGNSLYVLQGNPCRCYREIPVGITGEIPVDVTGKSVKILQGNPSWHYRDIPVTLF